MYETVYRIELAAGNRPTPGFVHQDFRELPDIDLVCDLRKICDMVPHGLYDEVRATHILEHFSHRDTVTVLMEWWTIMRPGGTLYVEVPNLMWQANALVDGYDQEEIVRLVYGDQDYEGNAHYTGFTHHTLKKSFVEAGFDVLKLHDVGMVLCIAGMRPKE